MYKKIIPVVFIIVASLIALIFIGNKYLNKPQTKSTSARIVIPQVESEKKVSVSDSPYMDDDSSMTSLVPLLPEETLIAVVSMDFDGDGNDDQVNAIKTASSPYLSLLVGLYNREKTQYERMALIATKITQVRTFSYTGIDLTGDHRLSLVYQGFAENGNSLLSAFFISRENGKFNLKQIASFEGDGSVFIQQLDRTDAYERSHSKGVSFPIWVYSTDSERPGSNDQLQTRYDWNAETETYVQTKQVRVPGSRIAAKDVERILDGTVETFAAFLDGLWYKTEVGSGMRYIFFDSESKEVIFFRESEEEVYQWATSTLRNNGMYLSTTNQEIESLQRRVDVSLRSAELVHVRIQEDLRMIISESNVWDGDYKKLSYSAVLGKKNDALSQSQAIIALLEKEKDWMSADGIQFTFEEGHYTVKGKSVYDTGFYTRLDSDDKIFIQFRSEVQPAFLSGNYRVNQNGENIILQAYRVSPTSTFPRESAPVILSVKTEQ